MCLCVLHLCMFVSFYSFDFCLFWFVICAPWCWTWGQVQWSTFITGSAPHCLGLVTLSRPPPGNAPIQHYSSTFSLIVLLYLLLYLPLYFFCIYFLHLPLPAWIWLDCCKNAPIKHYSSAFPLLFGWWLDVLVFSWRRYSRGRRARRKLSDENANSFLVKEEKAWCRIFPPVGRETAAYGSVQTLWRSHVKAGTQAPVACNVTRKTTPS